jgi:hypothetical protein
MLRKPIQPDPTLLARIDAHGRKKVAAAADMKYSTLSAKLGGFATMYDTDVAKLEEVLNAIGDQ